MEGVTRLEAACTFGFWPLFRLAGRNSGVLSVPGACVCRETSSFSLFAWDRIVGILAAAGGQLLVTCRLSLVIGEWGMGNVQRGGRELQITNCKLQITKCKVHSAKCKIRRGHRGGPLPQWYLPDADERERARLPVIGGIFPSGIGSDQ